MVPYPIALGEFEQQGEQKLQVQLYDVQHITDSGLLGDLASIDVSLEILKFIDIDAPPVVPDRVVLGVLFEQLGSLLKQGWREFLLLDLNRLSA